MHNAPHDLRDYVLDELDTAQRTEVETWLAGSTEGRQEVERLRLTFGALRSLPDEEPPRRIAFISDKIFEPSPWVRLARWVQAEGPRFAVGMAAALAVVFAGLWATEPTVTANAEGWSLAFGAPPPAAPAPVVDQAAIETMIQQAVAAERERMRVALQQTLAASFEDRVRATEAKFSSELAGTREDIESSLYLTNSKVEQFLKELSQTEVARAE